MPEPLEVLVEMRDRIKDMPERFVMVLREWKGSGGDLGGGGEGKGGGLGGKPGSKGTRGEALRTSAMLPRG